MSIFSENTKQRDLFIGLPLVALFMIGGLLLLFYEQAKSRDAVRASTIHQLQGSLELYARSRASYPPTTAGAITVGVEGRDCLGMGGFVGSSSQACTGKPYFIFRTPGGDSIEYMGIAADGSSPCTSSVGCPQYRVTFRQETGSVYGKKGFRVLTPAGIQ